MKRRKFVVGLGSLAAGGAAAMGTGAFESQEAVRQGRVKVKNDENAAIQLTPIGDYASIGGTNGRTLQVKFDLQNDRAFTEYGEQFRIGNRNNPANPDEDYEVWITVQSDVFDRNEGIAQSGGQPTDRIVALDTDGGQQLNNVTNSKPSSPPVIGPGDSVDVEVTVDTRDLKNLRPNYSSDFVLVKSMTVHTERV
jgi:hypothetical protein